MLLAARLIPPAGLASSIVSELRSRSRQTQAVCVTAGCRCGADRCLALRLQRLRTSGTLASVGGNGRSFRDRCCCLRPHCSSSRPVWSSLIFSRYFCAARCARRAPAIVSGYMGVRQLLRQSEQYTQPLSCARLLEPGRVLLIACSQPGPMADGSYLLPVRRRLYLQARVGLCRPEDRRRQRRCAAVGRGWLLP